MEKDMRTHEEKMAKAQHYNLTLEELEELEEMERLECESEKAEREEEDFQDFLDKEGYVEDTRNGEVREREIL